MILPFGRQLFAKRIRRVPSEYEEASIALGATKLETVRKVSFLLLEAELLASIILGTGRRLAKRWRDHGFGQCREYAEYVSKRAVF